MDDGQKSNKKDFDPLDLLGNNDSGRRRSIMQVSLDTAHVETMQELTQDGRGPATLLPVPRLGFGVTH